MQSHFIRDYADREWEEICDPSERLNGRSRSAWYTIICETGAALPAMAVSLREVDEPQLTFKQSMRNVQIFHLAPFSAKHTLGLAGLI
jgi:hypothetical protein